MQPSLRVSGGAPGLCAPLRRRVRRLQPVPRRQWTLRCHSRSRGQESQFPAPLGKQPGAARRPEAVAPPCAPRSAVALVPRSSAKEGTGPALPAQPARARDLGRLFLLSPQRDLP